MSKKEEERGLVGPYLMEETSWLASAQSELLAKGIDFFVESSWRGLWLTTLLFSSPTLPRQALIISSFCNLGA